MIKIKVKFIEHKNENSQKKFGLRCKKIPSDHQIKSKFLF